MRPSNSLSTAARVVAAMGLVASMLSGVNAHGRVHHVTADGTTATGSNPYAAAKSTENSAAVTRVMYKNDSPAFVLPQGFNDPSKMSCEGSGNAGAPASLKVKAGSTVSMFWVGATGELNGKPGTGGLTEYNTWVHAMGPIQDYITSCNGKCSEFDATNAGWTKLAGEGIDTSQSISNDLRQTMSGKPEPYYPKSGNGLWAMAKFVQQGSKWDVKVPAGLKSGEYILRQELAAVHNPLKAGDGTTGPQMYIACAQIEVTDGGDLTLPAGTKSSELYETDGDFAKFNVYSGDPTTFKVPGPAVWDQVSSGDGSSSSSSPSSGSSSSKAAASAATQSAGNNNNAVVVATGTSAAAASASSTAGKKCTRDLSKRRHALKRRLVEESV